VLNKLNTVPYLDRKDRNPRRIPGTCEWFVGHRLFRDWLEGVEGKSKALSVSADPGCGKWVLAKHLVDDVLATTETRTTCYFFFKDDFEDQKSAINALCCILHQLFTQKPALFSEAIHARLEAEGPNLSLSFRDLWDMLVEAADHEEAGEILCILDALDECKSEDCSRLINALLDLQHTKKAPNLRFLLTSRPYGTIRRSFQLPDAPDLAVIHLSGENEAEIEQISKEIDVFIKARVQGIGARLMLDEQQKDLLLHGLLGVPHRTYLWVYLTLNLIESDENIKKGKIRQALSQLPMSVDGAYEKVLSASRDPDEARKALNIIVAAERPLTLGEMNFALALRPSHHSYEDVDLASDESFRERLRDICGLFVTVIESRIYLLHQSAREFLVNTGIGHTPPQDRGERGEKREQKRGEERLEKNDVPNLRWKHSLQPSESHRILGEICLWNLQFPELHNDPISGRCTHIKEFKLLEYSAFYWAVHLTAPHVRVDKQMTEAILDICRVCHQHRPFWFRVVAKNFASRQNKFMDPSISDETSIHVTLLMVASFFGIAPAVEALIKRGGGGDLLARDYHGRTALSWAAAYGHHDAARILIDSQPGVLRGLGWLGLWKPAIIEAADSKGITPLMYAVRGESESVAKLLLDRGADLEARDDRGATALWWVADSPRCAAVVRLLLERGADIEIKDRLGKGPLYIAAQYSYADAARLLLDRGADVNSRNGSLGATPLMAAIGKRRTTTAKLLLEHNADIRVRTEDGSTAFSLACHMGQLDLVKLLLVRGADVESKDLFGVSALAEACQYGHEAVARLLIEHGADVESRDVPGKTVLYYAWFRGMPYANESVLVANLLLENGADVNAKDSQGRSVLAAVAALCNGHGVQWLLKNGADLESEDMEGRTPLAWAVSEAFDDNAIPVLLEAGANVNARDRDGRSILQMATDKKLSPFVIKLLIQYGAELNPKDKDDKQDAI
jgi:ankyrin repeat protein